MSVRRRDGRDHRPGGRLSGRGCRAPAAAAAGNPASGLRLDAMQPPSHGASFR